MFNQVISLPALWCAVAAITISGGHGHHSGSFASLDITQVIAHINAVDGGNADGFTGKKKWRRMGFAMWRRVTTDNRCTAIQQAESVNQLVGKALGLNIIKYINFNDIVQNIQGLSSGGTGGSSSGSLD